MWRSVEHYTLIRALVTSSSLSTFTFMFDFYIRTSINLSNLEISLRICMIIIEQSYLSVCKYTMHPKNVLTKLLPEDGALNCNSSDLSTWCRHHATSQTLVAAPSVRVGFICIWAVLRRMHYVTYENVLFFCEKDFYSTLFFLFVWYKYTCSLYVRI